MMTERLYGLIVDGRVILRRGRGSLYGEHIMAQARASI